MYSKIRMLFAVLVVFTFCGCSGGGGDETPTPAPTQVETTNPIQPSATSETESTVLEWNESNWNQTTWE